MLALARTIPCDSFAYSYEDQGSILIGPLTWLGSRLTGNYKNCGLELPIGKADLSESRARGPLRESVTQDVSIKRWRSQQMIGSDHPANPAP